MHKPVAFLAFTAVLVVCSPSVNAGATVYSDSGAWSGVVNQTSLVNFDAFNGPVYDQYAGVVFDPLYGGVVRATDFGFALSPPYLLDYNPGSFTGGGGVAMTFDPPVDGVGFWIGDSEFEGNIVTAFDIDGNQVVEYEVAYPLPLKWQFIGLAAAGPRIARVEFAASPKDYVPMDDLSFGYERTPDLNHNGIVNGIDLALFLGSWGPCTSGWVCPADLDGNGAVNGLDLAFLLGSWGPYPPANK